MQCAVQSNFRKPEDQCLLHPNNCDEGVAFSIFEKFTVSFDVLNIFKSHSKRYIFSTGGDFDTKLGTTHPGLALYHQGMDVIAVVSTGEDVWRLQVRGPIENQTWVNYGVNFIDPAKINVTVKDPGGLELYLNALKIGHALVPMMRPGSGWKEMKPLRADSKWQLTKPSPPIILVGCQRTAVDKNGFRDFGLPGAQYDELAVWIRRLIVNITHNEMLYYTGGYSKRVFC